MLVAERPTWLKRRAAPSWTLQPGEKAFVDAGFVVDGAPPAAAADHAAAWPRGPVAPLRGPLSRRTPAVEMQ